MKAAPYSVEVPLRSEPIGEDGKLTAPWQVFFINLRRSIDPLGIERTFELVNNQAAPADVEAMTFSARGVSQAAIDYLIQRVTTGGGAQELIETGTFYVAYKPTSANWVLSGGPTTAGITLTVTAAGQVQYASTNITGTASISKIAWRARTLACKNEQYSEVGR